MKCIRYTRYMLITIIKYSILQDFNISLGWRGGGAPLQSCVFSVVVNKPLQQLISVIILFWRNFLAILFLLVGVNRFGTRSITPWHLLSGAALYWAIHSADVSARRLSASGEVILSAHPSCHTSGGRAAPSPILTHRYLPINTASSVHICLSLCITHVALLV